MNSINDILICSRYMSLVDRAIRETWWLVKRILGVFNYGLYKKTLDKKHIDNFKNTYISITNTMNQLIINDTGVMEIEINLTDILSLYGVIDQKMDCE